MNRIGDYGLIGDCHSAALVGRDGSIDWACFPRFDSPAVFCRILDVERGGSFSIQPANIHSVARAYLEDTNVLVTTFTCETGVVTVTDCMPLSLPDPGNLAAVASHRSILRRVVCTSGSIDVDIALVPRFEYGAVIPRVALPSAHTAIVIGGADALTVRASHALERGNTDVRARWHLDTGEEAWIEMMWCRSYERRADALDPETCADDMRMRLDETVRFWRMWIERCWYVGDHAPAVRRSALVLKALTYAPSGAIVAAPTTSLPEEIGGGRNWDYRYTWIRDATMTLTALLILGFREEADAFKLWLGRAGAGRPEDLQIMYGIGGERWLPEIELTHLAGHRGSLPVRIGNGAVRQTQLDANGQILEAAFLYHKAGGEITAENWRFLAGLAAIVCDRWRHPDQGIWEIRDDPRHFVHSKLMCWVALDRAVRLAAKLGVAADARWKHERDQIRASLLGEAAPDGWFQQAVGFGVPDAATLLVPAMGLLPARDRLAQKTIEVVRRSLEQDGLVYRYLTPDGLEGGEGAFLLCSFWLLDCLTHSGRLDEADALLERLLSLRNDVGLFAEEIDVSSGEALGNFPQAFSHMALVSSCAHLSAAKRGEIPEGPIDYAECAVDRLNARARG